MENGLQKMSIISYSEKTFRGNEKVFELPVNPESFSKNFKVEYDTKRPPGKQGTSARFNSTAPEQFKIEFILDGTNAIEGYSYKGVSRKADNDKSEHIGKQPFPKKILVEVQLKNFLDTVYNMDGDIHRPRFCVITWGAQLFRGVLDSVDVNYSLFHPSGKPLRVKLNANFIEYIDQEEREKVAKQNSPDLTKIRQVEEGDRLDKMVSDLYDDPKFLIQVARANKLTSFRKIKPGIALRFPPIDKTEEV